jgi:anti-anti-sigma factor
MDILQALHGDVVEMRLVGRLDAIWADHVAAAVSEAIRAGHHRIALDMAGIDFLSSAGIGVLVRFHKQLRGIGGHLSVIRPSRFVEAVLGSMNLGSLIAGEDILASQRSSLLFPSARRAETEHAVFKVDHPEPGEPLTCRILGDPPRLARAACEEADCRPVDCTPGTFSLGIGAPGDNFAQCRVRFGEFLGVGGAAAFLPTGRRHTPDYLLARGTFVPRLQVLHGLTCEGDFSVTVSFQARPEHSVTLSELVGQCLSAAESDTIGIVLAAEIDGLVGTWLRRSPVSSEGPPDPFAFPEIRDFLRFTAERAFTSEVALVAGVASRAAPEILASSLRPVDAAGSLLGHFHAAAFTYHPLGKRGLGLTETVQQLFEWQALRGLLHLVHDTRPAEGLGESEFVRGTCWLGPIARIAAANDDKTTKGN